MSSSRTQNLIRSRNLNINNCNSLKTPNGYCLYTLLGLVRVMKTIFDYFENDIEYPNVCDGIILPFNTLYSEVSSNFLDAFINGCEQHIICYTLDYYREDIIEKRKLIDDINVYGYSGTHTKVSKIQDDVFIISKIDDGYMLFWYHLSGRCDIGRFTTNDTIEQIEDSVINWLEKMKQDSISGYSKIIANKYLKGWVGF